MTKDEFTLWLKNAVIVVVAVSSLTTACLLQIAGNIKNSDSFPRGILVNDVDLYGMSYNDALNAVTKSMDKQLNNMTLPVTANGKVYKLKAVNFINADIRKTVTVAYEAAKERDDIGGGECKFYTTYYIDTQKLKQALEDIAADTDTAVIEPTAEFDKVSRTFTYKEGKDGKALNIENALKTLVDKIENSDYSKTELTYDVVKPKHTLNDIKANTKLIAECHSDTTNNYNRNKNIDLMCSYVNGYVLEPDQVLSINELVGERTEEKGFLPAPAIMDGKRTVDDIGGGICQLSGTLFNTALRANMRIVERWPHSWPSDYLDVGLDSTLDWNTKKDLKIKNTSEYNIYLAAWLEYSNLSGANTLHVAAYGQPFPEGVTVKVYSEITESIEPERASVVYTSSLASGVSHEVIKARTGYRARVWREFYCNGVLLDSEIVSTSYYAPIRGEIQVGKGKKRDESHSKPNPTDASTPGASTSPTDEPIESPDVTENPIIIDPPKPTDDPIANGGKN